MRRHGGWTVCLLALAGCAAEPAREARPPAEGTAPGGADTGRSDTPRSGAASERAGSEAAAGGGPESGAAPPAPAEGDPALEAGLAQVVRQLAPHLVAHEELADARYARRDGKVLVVVAVESHRDPALDLDRWSTKLLEAVAREVPSVHVSLAARGEGERGVPLALSCQLGEDGLVVLRLLDPVLGRIAAIGVAGALPELFELALEGLREKLLQRHGPGWPGGAPRARLGKITNQTVQRLDLEALSPWLEQALLENGVELAPGPREAAWLADLRSAAAAEGEVEPYEEEVVTHVLTGAVTEERERGATSVRLALVGTGKPAKVELSAMVTVRQER